ncbi:eukaryotic translation initiation factor 2-alpha kinase 3-like [Diprion similis]|uniref:eukaryotic translation initiation factor 2-alpha kinase 3-like n=1 Tax=Diprion similis TaxID=362088 RepID=UPI001EF93399|nr:eukaryotic translation initiation factor 2-alpha kinase 3-like [Diprion similis]
MNCKKHMMSSWMKKHHIQAQFRTQVKNEFKDENNLYSSTVWNMIGKLIKTSLKNNLYSSTVWNIIGKLFRKTIQNNDSYSIDSISQSRTDNMQMKIFLYIQMELCQRHSLKEWLVHTAKTRDTQHSLKIFYQIVNAVQYIHNQDLIHRDLKPANIFFAPDDKIKVGDFGLISAIQADCNEYDTTSSISEVKKIKAKLNTAGVGTALYMAPEQKENSQSYNNKVDVYSLGIIFFELLEPMTTDMERSRKIGSLKNLTFPPDFEQRYPDECKLLKIMLHENPKRRPTASGIKRRPPLCNLRYGTDFEESTQISSSPRQTLEDRNKNSLCPPSALSTDPSDDHTEVEFRL